MLLGSIGSTPHHFLHFDTVSNHYLKNLIRSTRIYIKKYQFQVLWKVLQWNRLSWEQNMHAIFAFLVIAYKEEIKLFLTELSKFISTGEQTWKIIYDIWAKKSIYYG